MSIIIISYNTRELTLRCVADVYTDLQRTPAEVFVVDNGSADGSAAAVRAAFPAVVIIETGCNMGFGAANNLAMGRTTGEFVLLLNSDAFVHLGAIKTLSEHLRSHPHLGIAGPRLLNADGTLQRSCYKFQGPWRCICENTLLTALFPNSRLFGDYRAWAHDEPREVDFLVGACWLVRSAALREVGLFDEAFFLYAEEADLARRFRDAGWYTGFTPAADVLHLNGSSGKAQPDAVFDEFHRAQERFVRKHHGPVGLGIYRAAMIVGACLRIVVFALGATPRSPTRHGKAELARQWRRILFWTLGRRGPGLRAATNR